MTFTTAPLEKNHNRAAFSCGVEALDAYIKERALQDAKKRIAAPFVYIDPATERIVGYYTLSSYGVKIADLPVPVARKLPRYPFAPATLLGRLAVDKDFRGGGFGELLLLDALHRSLEGSQQVASFAVIVEAKDKQAQAFYERYGFALFKDVAHRLFLPMGTVAKLLSV